MDFEGESVVPIKEINSWIPEPTGGHIKRLASPASVNRDTRLLLTNAMYFRGSWARPFLPESTTEQLFHVSAKKAVPSRMMRQSGKFAYMETPDFKILQMPYRGDKILFVAVLPRDTNGLSKLERSLAAEQFRSILEGVKRTMVDVAIPRFETSTTSSLKDVLKKQGISVTFDTSADLSLISGKTNLYLTDIAHQAFIDVHEKGTEAAAATAVFVAKGLPNAVVEFKADQRFLYIIVDQATGTILFLGHVIEPQNVPAK